MSSGLEILRLMIDGGPHLQDAAASGQQADNFVEAVRQQAASLEANGLIYALESSSGFDAMSDLARIKTKVSALNFADDEFYRDSLQTLQRAIAKVTDACLVVRGVSDGSAGQLSMALWANESANLHGMAGSPLKWATQKCRTAALEK